MRSHESEEPEVGGVWLHEVDGRRVIEAVRQVAGHRGAGQVAVGTRSLDPVADFGAVAVGRAWLAVARALISDDDTRLAYRAAVTGVAELGVDYARVSNLDDTPDLLGRAELLLRWGEERRAASLAIEALGARCAMFVASRGLD